MAIAIYAPGPFQKLPTTLLELCIHAYPVWVWMAGGAVGFFGLMLSAAALMDSASGMFWTNVLLLPCILLWLAGVITATY